MLDKNGKEIIVAEENASEIARKEMELESKGIDPDKAKVEDIAILEPELSEEEKAAKEKEDKLKEDKENGDKEKTDEELIAAKEEDLSEEEKTKRIELVETEETETKRLLDMKEEEAEGDDIEKRKTAVLKNDTKQKEAFNTKITKYSEDKKINVDDARKTLESANKIIEKYSGDSEQIAIANLGLQHLVAKKDEEIQAVKQEANQPRRPQSAREWESGIKERGLTRTDGRHVGWETVVDDYRKANEEETEGMEDGQVLKTVAKEIHLRSDAHFREQITKAKSDADEKRDKLVSAIPDNGKQYSDEVKSLLKTVPDNVILKEDYTLEHSLRWARGGHFTPDKVAEIEKAAEEKGFIRGQASKKIISGPGGNSGPPKSKGVVTWTEKEKDEAFDMFPNVEDEKERFKLYKEVRDSRTKNKKK